MKVWVVETQSDGDWMPTPRVGLTREEADGHRICMEKQAEALIAPIPKYRIKLYHRGKKEE